MSAPPGDRAERRIGNVIAGKWRVDSLLGSGSMAAVYSVTHRNGARAALKILHPNLCTDQAVCERFLGEGYLTNSVKHSGICRVLDDGVTDDGCVFLVMDLLEGRTLEAYREERGGQVPLVELLDIADKLMGVLAAVHEAGIVHRDLKLQNVFVCTDGSVKLLDFGVARLFDGESKSKHSVVGMVLGTPSFMAPEQALGARDKVDHRSDIWSLGATLFTCLTGQTVHLGPHLQARLLAAATAQARSIALVRQDLPPSIAAAIDKALRFERDDRWQSVDAFRRALRDARAELGLGKPQSIAPPAWLESEPAGSPLSPLEDAAGEEETLIADLRGASPLAPTTEPQLPAAMPFEHDAKPMSPPATAPLHGHRDSRPEGSFPAAIANVPTHAAQSAPRSSLSTWVAAAVVAGALTGGAGFYVLRTPPAASASDVASAIAPASPTTAALASASAVPTAPAAPPSAVAMPEVDPKEARDRARDAQVDAGAALAAAPADTSAARAAAPRPPKKAAEARPSPGADAAAPAPTGEAPAPAPSAAPAPSPAPSASADPFGTPN